MQRENEDGGGGGYTHVEERKEERVYCSVEIVSSQL